MLKKKEYVEFEIEKPLTVGDLVSVLHDMPVDAVIVVCDQDGDEVELHDVQKFNNKLVIRYDY